MNYPFNWNDDIFPFDDDRHAYTFRDPEPTWTDEGDLLFRISPDGKKFAIPAECLRTIQALAENLPFQKRRTFCGIQGVKKALTMAKMRYDLDWWPITDIWELLPDAEGPITLPVRSGGR